MVLTDTDGDKFAAGLGAVRLLPGRRHARAAAVAVAGPKDPADPEDDRAAPGHRELKLRPLPRAGHGGVGGVADPLGLRLCNRGFTSGLVVGLLFFAVTSGLIYVISLYMQQSLPKSAGSAALGLLPLTIGIIISAFTCMALAQRLGRTLTLIGMLLTMGGAGWLLALVLTYGTGLSLWMLAPAVLLTGLGMGACYGTIFDIALGDIAPDEAGSASGSLTAIQQLANGIGSASSPPCTSTPAGPRTPWRSG